MPASDPIHKATIIPRGRALGMVMRLPERDSCRYTRDKTDRRPRRRHGRPRRRGDDVRLREGDLGRLLRHQDGDASWRAPWSPQWGMSDKLGPLRLRRQPGRGVPRPFDRAHAEHVGRDRRHRSTRKCTASSTRPTRARARSCSGEHRRPAHARRGLLEYETLSGEEIKDLLKGKPPVREFAAEVTPRPGPASAVPAAGRGKKAPPEPEPDTGGLAPEPST